MDHFRVGYLYGFLVVREKIFEQTKFLKVQMPGGGGGGLPRGVRGMMKFQIDGCIAMLHIKIAILYHSKDEFVFCMYVDPL